MIDFRDKIKQGLKAQKMKKTTLARLSGVPYSTINTYLSGTDTGGETIQKLLDVLNINNLS